MPVSVRYHFSQRFAVSAQKAFDWCTAFDPNDQNLLGNTNAQRQITPIAEGSIILKDTLQTPTGVIEKQKLVQLYPDLLTWAATHLTGLNKHSQFLYQIEPKGKDSSVLHFTAIHLEYDEPANKELLGELLCKQDSATWALLAEAMAKDLGAPASKGR